MNSISRSSARLIVLCLAAWSVESDDSIICDDTINIAGYMTTTDVESHASIDLDQEAIESFFDDDDWATSAKDVYENGGYSLSDSRTIQGFSTNADSKFVKYNFTLAETYTNYWGSWNYSNAFISSALDDTWGDDVQTNLGLTDDEYKYARQQCVKKGTAYMATLVYAMYELNRAAWEINYNDDITTDYSDPYMYNMVHYWDEGIAFFAGSLEDGSGTGKSAYTLAEKRASSFSTTTTNVNDGTALSNYKILGAAQVGRRALYDIDVSTNEPETVWNAYKCIERQAFIPTIQGCLAYGYKSSVCTEDCGDEFGEFYTFCSAMLPLLDAVSPDDATILSEYSDLTADTWLDGDWEDARATIYDNLDSMGYTCDEIGAYSGDDYTCDTVGVAKVLDYTDYCALALPVDESTACDDDDADADDDDHHDDDDEKDKGAMMFMILFIVVLILLLIMCVLTGVFYKKSTEQGQAVSSVEVTEK